MLRHTLLLASLFCRHAPDAARRFFLLHAAIITLFATRRATPLLLPALFHFAIFATLSLLPDDD